MTTRWSSAMTLAFAGGRQPTPGGWMAAILPFRISMAPLGRSTPRADIEIAPAGEDEGGGRMGWAARADDAEDERGEERRDESSVTRGMVHPSNLPAGLRRGDTI